MKWWSIPVLSVGVLFGFTLWQTSLLGETEAELRETKAALAKAAAETEALSQTLETMQGELSRLQKQAAAPKALLPTDKIAYLTFDDGPSANTRLILDILQEFGAPGTFFVNGRNTAEAAALYRRMVKEGHSIGNHTHSHDYKRVYASPSAFLADVQKLDALLLAHTGKQTSIVRFPGGSNNTVSRQYGGPGVNADIVNTLTKAGYRIADWNVDSSDASRGLQSADAIVHAVLSGAKGQQVINVLMHDAPAKTTTPIALPAILSGLKEQGFRFEAMTDQSVFHQFLRPESQTGAAS